MRIWRNGHRIPPFLLDISYHSVLLPVAIVDTPDVLRAGRGGLFANLIRVADRIGEQVARCRATASGFREHDDDAAPGSEDPPLSGSTSTSSVYLPDENSRRVLVKSI